MDAVYCPDQGLFSDVTPLDRPKHGDTDRLIAALKHKYRERIVAEWVQPARPARTAPLPDGLDRRLVVALHGRGITRLYSHQAQALELALAGRHVAVATPTASGKSLCYHLPVLQDLLADGARALYLFPTKALAQDQLAELLSLNDRRPAGRAGPGGLARLAYPRRERPAQRGAGAQPQRSAVHGHAVGGAGRR